MAQKKNKNKQSGQLARQSQNKVNAPVASAIANRSSAPKIVTSMKMTKIVHRELVSTINGNTTFGVDSFSLNPGLSSSFPWLSSIAGSYEQYRFNRLSFKYITRAPTSYIGSILMAPEYDALDSSPSTELLASQMNGAIENTPWQDQTLTFNVGDMFPMGPRKYIRTGTLPTSSDLKTYDAGQLFVCTVDCADTSAIGKLWVEYEVELHIPQNPNAASATNVGSLSLYGRGSAQSLTTNTAALVDWDSPTYDGLGLTDSSGTITLSTGTFLCSGVVGFRIATTNGAAVNFTVDSLIDGVAETDFVYYHATTPQSGQTEDRQVAYQFVVTSSGSTTFGVRAKLVAASGTLTVPATTSSLSIQRVA
jgi:hypothetical protein